MSDTYNEYKETELILQFIVQVNCVSASIPLALLCILAEAIDQGLIKVERAYDYFGELFLKPEVVEVSKTIKGTNKITTFKTIASAFRGMKKIEDMT